jgi:MoxR-like ATPase
MDIDIERMDSSSFLPKQDLKYVDVLDLHSLYDGLAFRGACVMVGPKGIGKTLSVQAWAGKNDCPIITFDCSEDVRRAHLLGMQVLRGDQSPFILGPLTTAFEVANEVGQCIVALEEVNALTPQMQKALNAVTDWRAEIVVPECRRVFKLKSGAKLWVVGTMNTAVYGGVYELNEDLKSRMRIIKLDYPMPKAEKEILKTQLNGNVDNKILDSVILLAHETRQKTLEYALSTRDVVQILEDVQHLDLQRALRVALGKFDGNDAATVQTRMVSIFGNNAPAAPGKTP